MKTELKQQIDQMDRRYKNAYNDLDKIFKRMGEKDMYFILKRYYLYAGSAYQPEFKI